MKIWEQRKEKIEKNGNMNKKVNAIIKKLEKLEETTRGESYRNIEKETFDLKLKGVKKDIEKIKEENTKEILNQMYSDIEDRVEMKWLEVIINAITELREDKGITKNKLSDLSGVSGAYLWRLETGKRNNISLGKLKPLADVLEISLSELFLKAEGKDIENMFYLEPKEQKWREKIRQMDLKEELSLEEVNNIVSAVKELKK